MTTHEKNRKLFLRVESHLKKRDKIMESESHYFATVVEIVNSGKIHQRMLKLLGKIFMRKMIFTQSQTLFQPNTF